MLNQKYDKTSKFLTLPNGDKLELFYIGHFAKTVDRTTTTIRMWEAKHIIPETPFRDKHGRRLYSQEQIDVVNKFLVKYSMIQGRNLCNTNFSKNVYNHWGKLKEKYLRKV